MAAKSSTASVLYARRRPKRAAMLGSGAVAESLLGRARGCARPEGFRYWAGAGGRQETGCGHAASCNARGRGAPWDQLRGVKRRRGWGVSPPTARLVWMSLVDVDDDGVGAVVVILVLRGGLLGEVLWRGDVGGWGRPRRRRRHEGKSGEVATADGTRRRTLRCLGDTDGGGTSGAPRRGRRGPAAAAGGRRTEARPAAGRVRAALSATLGSAVSVTPAALRSGGSAPTRSAARLAAARPGEGGKERSSPHKGPGSRAACGPPRGARAAGVSDCQPTDASTAAARRPRPSAPTAGGGNDGSTSAA